MWIIRFLSQFYPIKIDFCTWHASTSSFDPNFSHRPIMPQFLKKFHPTWIPMNSLSYPRLHPNSIPRFLAPLFNHAEKSRYFDRFLFIKSLQSNTPMVFRWLKPCFFAMFKPWKIPWYSYIWLVNPHVISPVLASPPRSLTDSRARSRETRWSPPCTLLLTRWSDIFGWSTLEVPRCPATKPHLKFLLKWFF